MSTSKNITDIEKQITGLMSQGDRKAVDLTYQNYGNALFGIIRRIVKSEELAQEVLQEVPFIENPGAFAVTLETAGGNPTPNLEALVMIGNT